MNTYQDILNTRWVVIGFGIIATLGYTLDNILFHPIYEIRYVNYLCSIASGLVLVGIILKPAKAEFWIKIISLIFWFNLFISPFYFFRTEAFDLLFFRTSLFLWALIPVLGLLLGRRYLIGFSSIYILQSLSLMIISGNSFLLSGFGVLVFVLIIYTTVIYAFISSLNHFIREQEQAKDALNKSDAAKGKLLSIIGHDLRSPLMSLSSLAVLIDDEATKSENEELKEYVDILTITVDQTSFLVTNLLEWSRTQSNRIEVKKQPIAIESFLLSLKDLVLFQLNSKKIELHIGPLEVSEIYADQNSLQTILRNLVTNSIKFTNPGGQIRVETHLQNNGTQLSITDTGIGMTESDIKKLFNRDIYLSTKGTGHEKGTGVGFNLCLELMELHSGEIHIASKPNSGTTVQLFFPSKSE